MYLYYYVYYCHLTLQSYDFFFCSANFWDKLRKKVMDVLKLYSVCNIGEGERGELVDQAGEARITLRLITHRV